MREFIRNKIVNRVRQYGYRSAFAQIARAALRKMYQVNRHIVFVIPDFDVYTFYDPCIIPLTLERIQRATDAGELNTDEVQLLSGFLAEGCRGVCAKIDGKLAGYGLVQFEGEYQFGRTGRMIIPPNHVIVKNLLVFPDYWGHKLGKKMTEALLALIPSGCLPVGLIIPENRFAIRNWEKYGFQQVLQIKRWRWFRGHWQMHVERLADGLQVDELEQALIDGHGGNYTAAKFQGAI